MDQLLDASDLEPPPAEERADSPLDGALYLILLELDKLQAPLSALKQLSRCLPDDPDSAEIRRSIGALLLRGMKLELQIRPDPELRPHALDAVLNYFNDDLDDNDPHIAGTT